MIKNKIFGRFAFQFMAVCLAAALLAGCSAVPENTIFSAEDLPGSTIGVEKATTGADYAKGFEKTPEEGKPAAEVVEYDRIEDAVAALVSGELDCVICDDNPAKHYVSRNEGLQILPDIFSEEYYAFAVNKEKPELLTEIDTAMIELKNDGIIEKILDGYLGDNTSGYKYESPNGIQRSRGTVTVATNADYAPYIYKHPAGGYVGIDVDILNALCDKLGYEPSIKNMEFEKVIDSVVSGECDIGIGAVSVTKDRIQAVNFSESYAKGIQVIITRI